MPAKNSPLPSRSADVALYMPPKPPNPPDLVAELLALRPYIEHILCDGSRDPHVRAAAKDHVQTVMRKVIQHLPSYVPHEDGVRPWVTRIAYNEKIDVQRSLQRYEDIFGHDHLAADAALVMRALILYAQRGLLNGCMLPDVSSNATFASLSLS